MVIESLIPYNRNWKLPYVTVMYSTGPLFLSVIWQEYKRGRGGPGSGRPGSLGEVASGVLGGNAGPWDGSEAGRVRVLMGDEYNKQPWAFFRWHGGSSWHGRDAQLIFWMGRHWKILTACGLLLAGVVGLVFWWIWGRVLLLGERRKKVGKSAEWAQRIPLWRSNSSSKAYELVERHEV